MISMVKNAVKSALIQRKIEEYNARLDEQFVSYDSWIREREAVAEDEHSMRRDNATADTVQIVEYRECDASLVLSTLKMQEGVFV